MKVGLQIIEIVNTCSLTSWIFMFQEMKNWNTDHDSSKWVSPCGVHPLRLLRSTMARVSTLVVFFISYMVTIFGNLTIILSVTPGLQTPDSHVFLLTNLSLLDLCYTTSTVPQLLVNLHSTRKVISYGGCVAQLFIFLALGATECVLLPVMSFDRFVAICRPLHYSVIMRSKALPPVGSCILDYWFQQRNVVVYLDSPTATLWPLCTRSLSLWSPCSAQIVMCWHHSKWSWTLLL